MERCTSTRAGATGSRRTRDAASALEGTAIRYVQFRDQIRDELCRNPAGLTWAELQERLTLPYDRPCPTWTAQLEEMGLVRTRRAGPAMVWTIREGAL